MIKLFLIKSLFTFSALLITIFLTPSCTKDSPNSGGSSLEILTTTKWRMVRYGLTFEDVNIDWETLTASCETDNFVNFFPNQTVIYDEGATKCNAGDSQNIWGTHTWELSADNKTIRIDGANGVTLKILNLTNDKLTWIELDGPGNHDCFDLEPY